MMMRMILMPAPFCQSKPLSNKVEEVWKSHDWSWMNFLEATEHPQFPRVVFAHSKAMVCLVEILQKTAIEIISK